MTQYQLHLIHQRNELRNRIGSLMTTMEQYREVAWRQMYLRKADGLTVELLKIEAEMEKQNSRY